MADMSGLRDRITEWATEVAATAVEQTYNETLEAAPEDTGYLKSQIQTTAPQVAGTSIVATISTGAPYSTFTDAGTKPHSIDAVNAPLLVFYWPKIGGMFYGPHVDHPGTAGTKWFNAGVEGGDPMSTRWSNALQSAASSTS